jgi:hypothetical protein
MDDIDPATRQRRSTDSMKYTESGNLEAHIIADMLRIESITTEVREFKSDTKKRLDKIEGWLVAIVGITVSTLLATVGALVFRMLGS